MTHSIGPWGLYWCGKCLNLVKTLLRIVQDSRFYFTCKQKLLYPVTVLWILDKDLKPLDQRWRIVLQAAHASCLPEFPLPPKLIGVMWRDLAECCIHSGFASQLRHLELSELKSFKMSSKPAWPMSQRDSIIMHNKQTYPLLWREILCLPSLIGIQTFLKR